MRTRKDIENNEIGRVGGMRIGEDFDKLQFEVLLDIREALQTLVVAESLKVEPPRT